MFRTNRRMALEKFSANIPKEKLNRLVEAVQSFIDAGDFSETAYRHSKIPVVITENHNISVSMVPWHDPKNRVEVYRAAIYTPEVSKNNPLLKNVDRAFHVNEDIDALRYIKKTNKLVGTVDLATGWVDGVLSDINCRLCITPSYFASGKFKADEIAEIICHEVAHVLLYFACLVDVVIYNHAIVHSLDRILGYTDEKIKLNFIEDLGEGLGAKFNSDVVMAAKDKETLYNVLVTETAISRRNETGSLTYSNHSWEKLADNFVTRMGGGAALARALKKDDMRHHALIRHPDYNPATFHYVSEAAKGLFAIFGVMTMGTVWAVGLASVVAMIVTSMSENADEHDNPEERLKRIELGIIERLKDKNMPVEEREDTLQQLKVVRITSKDVKGKTTLIGFINRLTSGRYWGKGRADEKASEYMLDLEKLNANPLFAVRSQFGDY